MVFEVGKIQRSDNCKKNGSDEKLENGFSGWTIITLSFPAKVQEIYKIIDQQNHSQSIKPNQRAIEQKTIKKERG